METLGPILAVVAVLALIAGIVMLSYRIERKRTEALAAACQGMGLTFEPEGDLASLQAQGDLPLYNHGHSKKLKNVMRGQVRDRDVRIFDYQYTTGGGKNSHTWMQTVPEGSSTDTFKSWPAASTALRTGKEWKSFTG